MNTLAEVIESLQGNLPKIEESFLLKELRGKWIGDLWWVYFYRTGCKLTFQDKTPQEPEIVFRKCQSFGFMYAQLLNLSIGISEAQGEFPGDWSDPLGWWARAISGQIEFDFLKTNAGIDTFQKGGLTKIKNQNAVLLKKLKKFELMEPDGTAMGAILSMAQLIAKGKPNDSENVKLKRRRFVAQFWNPYLNAIKTLNSEIRQRGFLLIERDGKIKALKRGGQEVQVFPVAEICRLARGGRPKKI
jgi:hypothetical protein